MTLTLSLAELNTYRAYYADPRTDRTLVASVKKNGILEPLVVSTDGTHALLEDGNKRINLAAELGHSTLEVNVVHRTYPLRRQWPWGNIVSGALLTYLESDANPEAE